MRWVFWRVVRGASRVRAAHSGRVGRGFFGGRARVCSRTVEVGAEVSSGLLLYFVGASVACPRVLASSFVMLSHCSCVRGPFLEKVVATRLWLRSDMVVLFFFVKCIFSTGGGDNGQSKDQECVRKRQYCFVRMRFKKCSRSGLSSIDQSARDFSASPPRVRVKGSILSRETAYPDHHDSSQHPIERFSIETHIDVCKEFPWLRLCLRVSVMPLKRKRESLIFGQYNKIRCILLSCAMTECQGTYTLPRAESLSQFSAPSQSGGKGDLTPSPATPLMKSPVSSVLQRKGL